MHQQKQVRDVQLTVTLCLIKMYVIRMTLEWLRA